jgi:hypothetical protein
MGWKILESIEHLFGRPKKPEVEERELVDDLDLALDRLQQAATEVECQEAESFQERLVRKKEEQEQRAKERVQNQMRMAIEVLHKELQSGISPETMDELHAFYEELKENQKVLEKGSLRQRIESSLLTRVHQEVGVWAWRDLMDLLDKASLEWPTPGNLAPSATAEEIERAWRRNISEDEIAFLEFGIPHTGGLVVGIVNVWRAFYPQPESWLYRETALNGVGAALRARYAKTAIDALRADPNLFSGEVEKVLADELALVQKTLGSGLESVEEAHRVVGLAAKICHDIVPTIVWNRLKHEVKTLQPS